MSRSLRPGPLRRALALVLVGGLGTASCSASEGSTPTTRGGTVATTAPSTLAPSTSSTIPPTTPGTPPTTNTQPPATTTTTTLPPTTTTEPVVVQELVLRGDGIGSAIFGAAPDGVIEHVTSFLGGATGESGWVDPFTFADCGAGGIATVARRVDWGVLSLLFSDGSIYAAGRPHFIGYEYGLAGQIGDQPVGLRTAGGVTLGSRVIDLLAEFPDASINAGETDINIPANFYESDVFRGLLTGTTPDDVVTAIFGGYGCGE